MSFGGIQCRRVVHDMEKSDCKEFTVLKHFLWPASQ